MRRRFTIGLHWTVLGLLVLLLAGGVIAEIALLYAICGFAMGAIALFKGLMNGPGPKLTGTLRSAHPWLSWGMYAVLVLSSGITLRALMGNGSFGIPLPRLYFVTLSIVALHAIFHLWRHTALGDGALQRITPKALHGIL
ncbi:hypothetical protein [Ascidiaceihabitans sp.]|uniref:hypothetical protein n=1 Tax=Ascidiaceihabitans sp. TaxID=1872644 RepID=UPI003299E2D0